MKARDIPIPWPPPRGRTRRKPAAVISSLALGLLGLLLLAPTAGAATRGLELGFSDPGSGERSATAIGVDAARALGAGIVRIEIGWAAVASRRPRNGADPNDPAYRWSEVDARVRDATSRGFRVLPLLFTAPRWAEGPARPSSAQAGTWLPDARAFGQFAQAAARRYRHITQWQIWNEPNLAYYLSPQWRRKKGRLIAVAPGHYRRMLNAAYAGLKRVNPHNRVVTAGTAPFGRSSGRCPNVSDDLLATAAQARHALRRRMTITRTRSAGRVATP